MDVSANPIVEENKNWGTTQWKISGHQSAEQNETDSGAAAWVDTNVIEGYADQTSIDAGESINFHISTTTAFYDIEIYRMGWYNGDGARLITTIENLRGKKHPVPQPNRQTGLIEAHWPVSYSLKTDETWVSGIYLAKLIASDGAARYIMFVVRDDDGAADILFVQALTTYQAYNDWGGKSLYDHNSVNGRAYKVSFDRPYQGGEGAGMFFEGDYNMVRWLEAQGYHVSYATSVDLEANPSLMRGHKVFLSNFHDEYWSMNMRDHITDARDAGKHLAFFDANNVFWQIRFERSTRAKPNRVIVCYKDAEADPMSKSITPWLTTVRWRDAPVNRPENELLGIMFDSTFDYGLSLDYVVSNAGHWIYEGTGVSDGDVIPSVIGHEYDRVYDNGLTPENLELLSQSPIDIHESISQASIYTAPGGGMVFSASTNRWAWLLDDNEYEWIKQDERIQRMTANLLNRMIGGTPALVAQPTFIPESRSLLKLEYSTNDKDAGDNQVKPHLRIINNSASPIPLNQMRIRYFFTRETDMPLTAWCDYAVFGCENIQMQFLRLDHPGADTALDITFSEAAGTLPPKGSSGVMNFRFNKDDWSKFNELDDFSYGGDPMRVALYRNDKLIWGIEPAPLLPQAPTETPAAPVVEVEEGSS